MKKLLFLTILILSAAFCSANSSVKSTDSEPDQVIIQCASVHGAPKGTYINASISGHTLTVVFSQNLGDVDVEVLSTSGNFMHNAVDELEVKS